MKLKTRWENWKLRRQRRWLQKESGRARAEARQKSDDSIYEKWYTQHGTDLLVIDAAIQTNISRDILDRAEKLSLFTPALNELDKWVKPEDLGFPLGGP